MSLTLKKVRGSDDYQFSWSQDGKVVQWVVNGGDVDPSVLFDIVNTAAPEQMITIPPTIPQYPVDRPWPAELTQVQWNTVAPYIPGNEGAEAADRAARNEEMRLRNMGSALASGVGLAADDIPVVDSDRNDLPAVNWGA